jgi:hypothetical protein
MRHVGRDAAPSGRARHAGAVGVSCHVRPSVVVVSPVRPPRGSVFSHPRAAATAATVTASTRHPGPGSRMWTGATAASALRGGGGRMGPRRVVSPLHTHSSSDASRRGPCLFSLPIAYRRRGPAGRAVYFFLSPRPFSPSTRSSPTARRCPVQTLRRRCPFP